MQQVTTGNPTIDAVLTVLGALYTLLTALAAVPLPKGWSFAKLVSRYGADVRNVHAAAEEKVPPTLPGLLILLCLTSAWVQGCAFFRDVVGPAVVECAPDRQYVIENLNSILQGERPFDALDRIKGEKGVEFVLCALQQFVERIGAGEDGKARATARAYIAREKGE